MRILEIFVSFVFLAGLSCSQVDKKKMSINEINCNDGVQQNLIFRHFSEMTEIEDYIVGEDTVRFILNGFTNKVTAKFFLQRSVRFISRNNHRDKRAIEESFEFIEFIEKSDTLIITLERPLQGLTVYAKFRKIDCDVELLSYETWEH